MAPSTRSSFQRLKDKLGNRSNASSEVEFHGAYAERVGDEGKGIRTIIQMVQLTRQDCAIASAGLMRSGLAHALHHARHRSVFQKHLADQPLMQAVLSDMALHVEASIALVMRLCRSFDRAPVDAKEAAYMRLLTPAIKYWVCKSAPGFLYEAMECLGGNGYVEEGILARHYRESPVNAIWEGSGNVMCLDVLRALSREAGAASSIVHELTARDAGLAGRGRGRHLHRQGVPPAGQRARGAAGGRETGAAGGGCRAQCRRSRVMRELFAGTRLAGNHAGMYGAVDLAQTTSAACWGARCREFDLANESRLMDSLTPASAAAVPPAIPDRPPRVWKFWGTTLWGLFIFAAMFLGQVAVIAYFVLRQGGPLDVAEAIRVVGGGLTISLSVILGLPAVLLATWIAIRPTRMTFTDYLALRWTSWRNFFVGVAAMAILVGGWDLLSRALGREVTPGFMGEVLKSAQADGALWLLAIAFCVAAPMWEEIFARGFLYRGWSESRLGVAGAIFLSSLAWTSLHLQYDWFFFGEVFSLGLLLGYLRYRTNSTWLTIVLHGINNLAATIQTFWLAGQG